MFIRKCKNCGALLELPDEAREARCSYCGITNHVDPPGAITAPRGFGAQQSHVGLALTVGGVLVGLVALVAFFGLRSASATSVAPSPEPSHREQLASERAHRLVVERARQMILSQNCTPLVEATDLRGAYDLVNTLQANPSSPCVTLMAETGHEGNALKLWLNEPSGDPVATPAPSGSLQVRYCAKTTGSHPARIVPQGDWSYTLAVLECPR